MTWMLDICHTPTGHWGAVQFSSNLFSVWCSELSIFYCSVFKFTVSSVPSILLFEPIIGFYISYCVFHLHLILYSVSLLRLLFFKFVSGVFVIAHRGIVIMTVLKSLSGNSHICAMSLWASVDHLTQVEIFLVLCVMSDFPLKSGHFEYYEALTLFGASVWAAFLWHCSGGKGWGDTALWL